MLAKRFIAIASVIAALAGLGGVLAGVAIADHQFPDVPAGSPFHDDIDNFANAGCASGFPDGTFRPQEPVKRQQMARFVTACGGRIEFDTGAVATVTTSETPIISNLNMVAGALGEGAGRVQLLVAVHASSSSTTGFPCELLFDATGITGEAVYIDLNDTDQDIEDGNATILHTFTLDAGFNANLFVNVSKTAACGASVSAEAEATMTYFPFNSDGSGGAESVPVTESVDPPRTVAGG